MRHLNGTDVETSTVKVQNLSWRESCCMPKRSCADSCKQLATHFPLQNQKYARNTPLNALRRSISFALPSRDFASLSAVCNEISLLKTKHFTPRLLTTGLHVRILTGEPVCFYEHRRPGERCEST